MVDGWFFREVVVGNSRNARSAVFGALAVTTLVVLSNSTSAAPLTTITITVDENGNGTINGFAGLESLPSTLQSDPGPGGLASVLAYSMLNPPGLTAGDVLLTDNGVTLDVIRFNPSETCVDQSTGCLVFYSDNIDGFDSIGDTSSPPGAFYTNVISIPELGTESNNGAFYTPTVGEPGFVAGAAVPVTYDFISDGSGAPVPEPMTLSLFGAGIVGAVAMRSRKTKKA
jgi:hypothetical protein